MLSALGILLIYLFQASDKRPLFMKQFSIDTLWVLVNYKKAPI
jgi:hypothetical protein